MTVNCKWTGMKRTLAHMINDNGEKETVEGERQKETDREIA